MVTEISSFNPDVFIDDDFSAIVRCRLIPNIRQENPQEINKT
jgi:hypothetical protein